ncbi:hypothetical protein GCM10010394_36200 [Streptomyces crystallinus]|uniref:DUF397 domain-containing protein n=1 Tax=Streptomyces crystallinus TaxID=68191 RepID=A0ABP3R9W7_9ACTN
MEASGRGGSPWRKSAHSDSGQGNCVEVRVSATEILLRDSAFLCVGPVRLSRPAWNGFLHSLKGGRTTKLPG